MPISIPVIEMVEIGAGGGSLARVDGMRQIRVGPESAGSEPGPACYQRGGQRPAVTDADLLLGRLDAANFAGGDIILSPEASEAAITSAVGGKLGMKPQTAAIGICEVVDENMANAARVHAVESGKELADFTMIAFGGAAPLHAARLCEKLGISTLLIPPGAGVGSAIGFLRAPFSFEAVRGAYLRLALFDATWVNDVVDGLRAEAEAFSRAGNSDGDLIVERKAFMRYQGQGWEIAVNLPDRAFRAGDEAVLRDLFETEYARLFGRPLEGLDIEVMNWSVRAASSTPPVERVSRLAGAQDASPQGQRRLYDAGSADFVDAAVVDRAAMVPGTRVSGPAVIVESETTTIVTTAYYAVMQSDGCLLVQRKD